MHLTANSHWHYTVRLAGMARHVGMAAWRRLHVGHYNAKHTALVLRLVS